MSFLTDQSPDGKRKRIMAAVGGGGVLALILLLSRRGGGDTGRGGGEQETVSEYDTLRATSVPSTFADNGEAMSGLSYEVTGALGDVALALEDLGAGQAARDDAYAGQFDSLGAAIDELRSAAVAAPVLAAPAAVAAAGQPGPRATAKPKISAADRAKARALGRKPTPNTASNDSAANARKWNKRAAAPKPKRETAKRGSARQVAAGVSRPASRPPAGGGRSPATKPKRGKRR